jgi:hypothetical protein
VKLKGMIVRKGSRAEKTNDFSALKNAFKNPLFSRASAGRF